MRWWGGERWSDEFLKTRSELGGSGTAASPKPSPRSGGAPWWAWVVAMIVAIVVIAAIVGPGVSSNDGRGTTQTKDAAASPPAVVAVAARERLTRCLTSAGVRFHRSGPSAHLTSIDSEYVGTVTVARGGSADLWVMSPVKQLHPIRRAREIAETSGGGYYWDADRNIVFAIPAEANLSRGDQVGKKIDACLNG
jgi:hypothetical protein